MKRVLVTGGTGRLGAALVKTFVDERWHVTANFYRDARRAEQLQRATHCELMRADVSSEREAESLFENKNFDAVVHLAARSHDALLLRTSNEMWLQSRRDLDAAWLITRASLRFLPRGGHLILLSSRVGERGNAGQSAYGAHKAATLGLMRAAAREGRDEGICVNAVCPGFASSTLAKALSPELLARRETENALPGADATHSFAAFCAWLLGSKQSGKVWRPDCRI